MHRILIVDADRSALAAVASMLRSAGHEVIEATGDRTAVRLPEEGDSPGLVLLGVAPADPDPLASLARIRREHPRTPVILLVASPPDRYRRALAMGAAAVLKSPPAEVLRATVARALRADGASRDAVRPLREAVEDCERSTIARALRAFGGRRSETARALDIDRTTLDLKMRKYGLLG